MSRMLDMTPTSLAAAVVLRKGQIIKNVLGVFKRGENLLQNGILHFIFIFFVLIKKTVCPVFFLDNKIVSIIIPLHLSLYWIVKNLDVF